VKRRAAPAPVASASAAASSKPGESSVAPVREDEREDDTPAEPPGTPKSSHRARPAWGKLDNTRRSPTDEYAPQHSRPLEVFLGAAPLSGDVHGLIICRVQSYGHADTFAGDDLQARATFGGTPQVAADGPEDANLAFVSAPLATLKKGDPVLFEVYDRDVFEVQLITRATVPYGGSGLSSSDPGAAIECRVLSGDALTRTLKKSTEPADGAIAKLGRAHLDPYSPTWGWPEIEIMQVRRDIGDVAAIVGWDDARTGKRLAAHDAALAALDAQKQKVFDDLHGKAKGELSLRGIKVKLEDVVCGPAKAGVSAASVASPCVVTATLTNDTGTTLRLKSPDLKAYVATARGPSETAQPVDLATSSPALELDAKSTMRVMIDPQSSVKLDLEPSLLGVCVEGGCAVLKLR
jgi:hypothetical protein